MSCMIERNCVERPSEIEVGISLHAGKLKEREREREIYIYIFPLFIRGGVWGSGQRGPEIGLDLFPGKNYVGGGQGTVPEHGSQC